ncbi:MAG: sigma-70 family RNA polymerase sigma factor [Acidobacteria bacterium]|nr:sigma-70 family RNA polymerase sigma factor [Acidobacteriota bacterium]
MPNSLTSDSLSGLLKRFSSNEEEAARAYTELREKLVRYFRIKGLSEADDAADLTLDRLAEKVRQAEEIADLTKYAFGVAKNVFREILRASRVEGRAVVKFYEKSGQTRRTNDTTYLEPLRRCFDGLYEDEQELLTRYYEDLPADQLYEHRQALAKKQKVSLNVLRNRVSRIRKRLEDCVDKKK